ncbi:MULTISPECIES: hypothetical protein [unclassified Caballeronia]|nr:MULTISPECIES: hypothetical protein [unclassified Caballeronia]MDR5739316.1 hypothetical protein [Caballeronia sp. LZ016]MDR5807805.1 hypothetical protein [Caballeronia sp. LZ019]
MKLAIIVAAVVAVLAGPLAGCQTEGGGASPNRSSSSSGGGAY